MKEIGRISNDYKERLYNILINHVKLKIYEGSSDQRRSSCEGANGSHLVALSRPEQETLSAATLKGTPLCDVHVL